MNFKNLKAPQQFPRVYFPEGNPSLQLRFGKMGINWDGGNTGSGYEPEYQAVLDYAIAGGFALPSVANQAEQNQLVIDLKAAGVWTELDVFYNFLTDGDAAFATINWKDPAKFQATNNEATFTKLKGFKGNGTSAYLNTNYIPSTENYQLNNAAIFAEGNIGAVQFETLFGVNQTGNIGFRVSQNAGNDLLAINTAGFASGTIVPADTDFFIHLNKIVSTEFTVSIDGGAPQSKITPSTSMPTLSGYLLGLNDNGNLAGASTGYIYCFGMGSSLSGKEAALYNAWNAYKTVVQQDLEYQEILEYADVIGAAHPSSTVQALQKQLINDLKAAAIWDELDTFYCFAGDGDEAFALIDWKRKGAAKAVNPKGTNTGAQYIVNQGFKGNGTSAYIDTNIETAQFVKGTIENIGVFADISESLDDPGCKFGYLYTGVPNTGLGTFSNGATQCFIQVNEYLGTTPITVAGGFDGFWNLGRTNPTDKELKLNGTSYLNSSGALSFPPLSHKVFLLAESRSNNPIRFSTSLIGCFGLGSSFLAKDSQLRDLWNTYKSALPV